MKSPYKLLSAIFTLATHDVAFAFNNPPGVDIWCGKAYRATNASFNPGGWLFAPNATSSSPLLDLRVYPRMNFYLNDQNGSFIVDAPISYIQGQKFSNSTFNPGPSTPTPSQPYRLRS